MQKRFIGFMLLLTSAWGCTKLKENNPSALTGTQVINAPASSIRLFNFSGQQLDVKVNNIPLTAFSSATNAQGNQLGLALFPTNVWNSGNDGSPVTFPTSLENKQSEMPVIIEPRNGTDLAGLGSLAEFYIDTTLLDDPVNPKDYYVMANGKLMVIPRNSVSPASPQNFKIRIYNLMSAYDTLHLGGNLTLTYSDGTPVSPALSGIKADTCSAYVELPMGAYQFRLYCANGATPDYTRQLSELPQYPIVSLTAPNFSPTFPVPQVDLTTLVRGFQPGGTYSLVVTPNIFGYDLTNQGSPTYFLLNSYRVITEQAAPTNVDWAEIQGVNVLSGQGISFTVDGAPMGNNIAYGTAGNYSVVSKGTHVIKAMDASGNVLSQQTFPFNAFDIITAWAWMQNDTPRISFTNVDWTSTLYESPSSQTVNDGTDGSTDISSTAYCQQYRFMNFSDIPYLTYTTEGNMLYAYTNSGNDNGSQIDTTAYPQAFINLQPGVPTVYNPFVIYGGGAPNPLKLGGEAFYYITGGGAINGFADNPGRSIINPFPLRVYASQPAEGIQPAQVPGEIIPSVPSMPGTVIAAGTQIYDGNGMVPAPENGLYTIALIGTSTGSGPSNQLQLIAIKHNK